MKIGLFFGSFNPIHIGHLIIAGYFAEETDIDQVLFIPSPQNPLKSNDILLAENDRLEMVRLCIRDNPGFGLDEIEFSLPRPSYTINTLRKLKKKYPGEEMVIIIGSDSLENFHLWRNYDEILQDFMLYVYPRNNSFKHSLDSEFNDRIKIFGAPLIGISSTMIRQNKEKGFSNNYLVFHKALDYFNKL